MSQKSFRRKRHRDPREMTACQHRPLSRDEQDFAAQPTQFHGILKRILPVALRLASGPEPVARQLFEPLVTSLVHWFTRAARRWADSVVSLGRDTAAMPVALQVRASQARLLRAHISGGPSMGDEVDACGGPCVSEVMVRCGMILYATFST